MFGFDELAAFTHNLENAFDEVRNSRLLVTPELINLSLAALDYIKAMVELSPDPGGTNKIASADILSKLSRLTGSHKEEAAVAASPAPLPKTNIPEDRPANGTSVFYPGPDLMRNGANPLVLLSELRQLGSLQITASMAAVPPIAEIEPERCYVRWDMVLKTTAPRDAIRDVFIFVEDSCELSIEPVSVEAVSTETAVAATPATPGETAKKFPVYGRRAYDSPDTASSIRVPAAKLDQFVDLIGELVTVRARLGEIAARSEDPEVGMVSEDLER